MSKYEEFVGYFGEMIQIGDDFLTQFEYIRREKFGILDAIEADIERCRETGVLTCTVANTVCNEEKTIEEVTKPQRRGRTIQKNGHPGRSSSSKENSREPNPGRSRTTGQRKVLGEASASAGATANSALQNIVVKVERLTEELMKKHSEIANVPIKQEKSDMPPPIQPLIRQTRKRKGTQNTASNSDIGSIQIKEELIDIESKKRKASTKPVSSRKPTTCRDSDVQITPEPVETVNLVETDEEDTERSTKPRGRPKTKRRIQKETSSSVDEQKSEVVETARATRTKTRNAAKNKEAEIEQDSTAEKQIRLQNSSTEDDDKETKATKRTKAKKLPANKKNKDNSVYEDALSDTENSKKVQNKTENEQTSKNNQPVSHHVMNETIVLSKPNAQALNATVVIEKPKNPVLMNETVVINKLPNGNQQHMAELMTDDEDSPVRSQIQKKVKQVFSPYANSPVKKRVEAFEKLGAEANSEMPPRMTRTKTKAKEQSAKENEPSENEAGIFSVDNIPNSAKHGAIPKAIRTPIPKLNMSSQPVTFSGLKASQAEFRERELKRQQKEAEALSKKEALIQTQTEERRRKRELRQLKAQQMREALEKDKQKTRESADRQKQEKSKQLKAEKEEKLLKQRDEAARKRAQALKKAAEEKQKEEERKRLEERKKLEEALKDSKKGSNTPPYLKLKTPLLPTEDCYDSDDSTNANKPISKPVWQKAEVLFKALKYMRYVNVQKQHIFHNVPTTVDLKAIFPSIEPHKLKRTSSAIWNKSGLSTLPSMAEEDEYLTA